MKLKMAKGMVPTELNLVPRKEPLAPGLLCHMAEQQPLISIQDLTGMELLSYNEF